MQKIDAQHGAMTTEIGDDEVEKSLQQTFRGLMERLMSLELDEG